MNSSDYRRRLPHWRVDGATYFVTWRLAKGKSNLSPEERTVVLQAILFFEGQRYDLAGAVVMDDHAHAVLQPRNGYELSRILHSWKSFTAHQILKQRGHAAPLWQDESFDRIVRDQAEYEEKLTYIWNNPFRRWPDLDEYEWLWWAGKDD